MVEVAYLIYRHRYFYPVLVLFMFTVSVTALSRALLRTRKKMMALVNEVRLTPVVVGGWVRGVSSHRLLPGDVVVLQPGKALFDMVLLQGNCLCGESMLSGEVWPLLCCCAMHISYSVMATAAQTSAEVWQYLTMFPDNSQNGSLCTLHYSSQHRQPSLSIRPHTHTQTHMHLAGDVTITSYKHTLIPRTTA